MESVFISNYEGIYKITDTGDVISCCRIIRDFGRVRILKERKLKPAEDRKGYLYVSLCKDGTSKIHKIHRLVAKSFVKNPHNKLQVNHKDGNVKNNNFKNLEWVTSAENIKHAYDNNLISPLVGELNPASKLTIAQVAQIRRMHDLGESYLSLSKKFGVSKTQIGRIVKRRSWK